MSPSAKDALIRDLEMATLRLTHAPPRVLLWTTEEGDVRAGLVVAVGSKHVTEEDALRSLAQQVAAMLDSNVDHDRVFQLRLERHAKDG